MSWRNRPTFIDNWPKNVDYLIFIDESGDASLKHVIKSCASKKNTGIMDCINTIEV